MRYERQLASAHGYYDLGMYAEALEELQAIDPKAPERPETLLLKMSLLRNLDRWPEMKKVAVRLVQAFPEEPELWVSLADAARHADCLEAGRRILVEAEKRFPANAHIKFQLGCYFCRMQDLPAAEAYVRKAISIDADWERVVPRDEDLRELHPRFDGPTPLESE